MLPIVMILCLTAVVIYRIGHPTKVEVVEHIKEVKVAYIPEILLVLAGAEQAANGGYILTVGTQDIWYIDGKWKRYDPFMDIWRAIDERRVYAFMEAAHTIQQQKSYKALPKGNSNSKRQLNNSDVNNAISKKLVFDNSEKNNMLLPKKCHWEHPGSDPDEWIIVRN